MKYTTTGGYFVILPSPRTPLGRLAREIIPPKKNMVRSILTVDKKINMIPVSSRLAFSFLGPAVKDSISREVYQNERCI